jgi:LacI family transcriptional regulator
MARRATLKDVAELAEVSTATVARVLHNKGYVASATRRLVESALIETGYQMNAVAQGLRRQRTFTVGHLLHSFIPNQFFAAVAVGVEEVAAQYGCGVLMINTNGDSGRERKAVDTLIQRRVDAMLFTTATHVDNVRTAVETGVPVVQVERKTSVDTPIVTADNYGGAYAAVEHLIHLGHRRIAFIGVDSAAIRSRRGSAAEPDIEEERLSGFVRAMTDYGLVVDNRLIGLGSNYTSGVNAQSSLGYEWMLKFLDLTEPPTAAFATFDLFAAGALQALHERGLRVPDDISLVGFDDTYAKYFAPPLTTVEHPMEEMGRVAAGIVFQILVDPNSAYGQQSIRLPMRLKVRGSTAPPHPIDSNVERVVSSTTRKRTTSCSVSGDGLSKFN